MHVEKVSYLLFSRDSTSVKHLTSNGKIGLSV